MKGKRGVGALKVVCLASGRYLDLCGYDSVAGLDFSWNLLSELENQSREDEKESEVT